MLKCKIIQDLLPLYCDKLTSQESNEEIEKHLHECEDCTQIYENMCEKEESIIDSDSRDIQPLKKVNRKNIIRIVVSVLVSLVILFVVFMFVFYGLIPINSDKLDIDCKITTQYFNNLYNAKEPEKNSYKEVSTKERLVIKFTGDCNCTRVKTESLYNYNDDGTMDINENITIYPIKDLPFDDNNNEFYWSINADDIGEKDTLTIHCRDRDIKYNIKDLAEQAEREDK